MPLETDQDIARLLTETKRIALVGASAKPERASNRILKFMIDQGYDVVPVNPGLAGQALHGAEVVSSLDAIDGQIDMVDIFRRSDAVPPIVTAALARWPKLQTIWMQIGVLNAEATAEAQARGVDVVQDRCPKIEYQRLFGELRMGGFVTGRISSKLA